MDTADRIGLHSRLVGDFDLQNLRGLEVAPFNRPIVSKTDGNVIYIDHLGTEALIERHRNDPTIDWRTIVPIDVVVDTRPLAEVLGHLPKFDYIVASHVIEHIPNPIDWMEELRAILNPMGAVRFAVPDQRYTFDFTRQNTDVTEIICAHLLGLSKPGAHFVFDHYSNVRIVDHVAAWEGRIDPDKLQHHHSLDFAMAAAREAAEGSVYHDVHCWAFTPTSFAQVCETLARHGFLNFACAKFFNTEPYTIEFIVHLTPCLDREQAVASWRAMANATEKLPGTVPIPAPQAVPPAQTQATSIKRRRRPLKKARKAVVRAWRRVTTY